MKDSSNWTTQDRELTTADVRDLFERHMRQQIESELELDQSTDAAITLIELMGYDNSDSDHFGDDMGGIVQSLLMIVMARVPDFRSAVNEGRVTIEEGD